MPVQLIGCKVPNSLTPSPLLANEDSIYCMQVQKSNRHIYSSRTHDQTYPIKEFRKIY